MQRALTRAILEPRKESGSEQLIPLNGLRELKVGDVVLKVEEVGFLSNGLG